MSREEYRRRANDCRLLARLMTDEADRATLLAAARQWQALVDRSGEPGGRPAALPIDPRSPGRWPALAAADTGEDLQRARPATARLDLRRACRIAG